MDDRPIWEVQYILKLDFARTFVEVAVSTGNRKGLLQSAYGTQELREWALVRIKELIKEAIAIRNGRDISEYSLGVAKRLQKELVDADMWKEIRR